jgi:hypothetical protein
MPHPGQRLHKDEDFILKMKTHIHVMFIPPYCYHLSPLDFGAYGLVESRALPEEDGRGLWGAQLTNRRNGVSIIAGICSD